MWAKSVVTGAGSGIGRAFALELARRGGRVVCADVDRAGADETVRLVERSGGSALAVTCDVGRVEDVEALASAATEWFGAAPTLVVNNAGIGAGGGDIGVTPLEDWRRTVDVNLWGVVHGCHVFTPMLRREGRGGIINVASAASFAAAPRMSAYNVTKAGVLALSETLAAELAGSGVGVTVLCPTFVKTNIVEKGRIEASSAKLATTMMRLTGVSADDVARETLDAHACGELYVVPQLDARTIWLLKRTFPRTYARSLGLMQRVASKLAGGGVR